MSTTATRRTTSAKAPTATVEQPAAPSALAIVPQPAPVEAVIPPTPPADNKAKAIMVGPNALEYFNALKGEFKGEGKTKETSLTSEEAMDLLVKVASDRRFTARQKHDEETKELVYNLDGSPEMETVDLFEQAAVEIFAKRGNVKKLSTIDRLKAQLAALGVDVNKL